MIGVYMSIGESDMTQLLSIHKDNTELENFKAINQVVDMIDWHLVHKVMKYLDWEWMSSENGVPEVYQLKAKALEYGEQAVHRVKHSGSEYFIESGGIRAQAKIDSDGDIFLEVMFILESGESW